MIVAPSRQHQNYESDSKFSRGLLALGFGLLSISTGPTFLGLRLFFIVGALLILVSALTNSAKGTAGFERSQVVLLLALFVSGTIALLTSPVRDNFSQGLNWLLLSFICVVLTIIVRYQFLNPAWSIISGLMLLGFGDAIYVLFSLISNGQIIFSSTNQRPFLFEYYLQDAFVCALSGIAFFFFAAIAKSKQKQFGLFFMGLACVSALVILASRGALVSFLAGTAFTLIMLARRGQISRTIIFWASTIYGALALFLLTPAGNQLIQRFQAVSNSEVYNQVRRANFQQLALAFLVDHPLGLGWNAFSAITANAYSEAVRSTHSMYFSLGLDLGWVGAISYLVMLLIMIKKSFGNQISLEIAVLGSIAIAYLVEGLNDSPHVLPISLGWSLFFMVLYNGRVDEKEA